MPVTEQMSEKVPRPRPVAPTAALVALGLVAVGTGLALQSWWAMAGGVFAMTGAAWLYTEPTG